ETIHYGRLQGGDIVYLATRESSQYLRPYSRVGRRLPAYSTAMGKALLAERLSGPDPQDWSDRVPPTMPALTPHTIVDRDQLRQELTETLARGYAIDREENVLGVTCFAFALRLGGVPSDAISCSIPVERLGAREPQILEALRRTRHAIERMAPVDLNGTSPSPV
ncbi:MAG: IclR family transcriptional regulator C-terminal domain-containing protein, partial [Propionibacteriaceae bacterium]